MMIAAAATALAVTGTLVLAAPLPGDVTRGHALAKTWCTGCHYVEAQEVIAKDAVPSFNAIAGLKSTTVPSLQVFLQTRHQNMPDWWLTRQQINDVVSYIMSLHPK
jgi:mono/diheme cytochrome c family protein